MSLKDIKEILNEIENQIIGNRKKYNDLGKTIRDFRDIFDFHSAQMNLAIFENDLEKIKKETFHTIAVLVEILARA